MSKQIPLSVPNLDLDILDNIKETIESGWVSTGGKFIQEFEEKVQQYTKAGGTRSVQSGTAGLHISLRVLGVEAGEEIIAPTLTFIAAVNPIRYMGAYPVFMDCDDTLNMDPIKLRQFLQEECTFEDGIVTNNSSGRRIRGIIVVHVFGNAADLESIIAIADEFNLFVLEDATEALGTYYTTGKYAGKYCGTVGSMGVYSFNANKIITTGNGGMVASNNEDLLEMVNYLGVQAKNDPIRYIHDEIGYNYRLTNISAAYGISQIDRIENFISVKKENYHHYKDGIKDIDGLSLLEFNQNCRPNYWFYSLFIDPSTYGYQREQLMEKLLDAGIQTRPIWGLIHQQKPYADCQSYRIEKAIYYSDHILNLPCSSNLTKESVDFVLQTLRKK